MRGGLLALALAGHVSAPSRSRARVRASGATGQKCSGETQSDVSSMKSRMPQSTNSATEASWSTSIVSSSPPDSACCTCCCVVHVHVHVHVHVVRACPAPPGLCEPCGAGRHSTRGAARTSPGRWSRRWTAPCGRSPRRRCRGWPSPRGGARGPTHHHRHTVKERREPDPSHLQGARAWWPFSSAAAPSPSACTGAATACITAHVGCV